MCPGSFTLAVRDYCFAQANPFSHVREKRLAASVGTSQRTVWWWLQGSVPSDPEIMRDVMDFILMENDADL